jgi:hypothetical protein
MVGLFMTFGHGSTSNVPGAEWICVTTNTVMEQRTGLDGSVFTMCKMSSSDELLMCCRSVEWRTWTHSMLNKADQMQILA